MFTVVFTPETLEDMHQFSPHERRQIINEIEQQLRYQPSQPTRNRKRLRPNALAEWELRIETFRVFYDLDEESQEVKIEAVGYKKGNQLFVHGERYHL